jgi:hypothetical protein
MKSGSALMGSSDLAYTPPPDVTPESELAALAAVYRYILDRHHAKKKPDGISTGEDAKEGPKNDLYIEATLPEE